METTVWLDNAIFLDHLALGPTQWVRCKDWESLHFAQKTNIFGVETSIILGFLDFSWISLDMSWNF